MSDHAPAESPSVHELGTLVRHLADELAAFRRRALVAEARVKELDAVEGGSASLDLIARVAQLEQQNEQLEAKLEVASTKARQMLDRVRFLRQQAQGGAR